MNAQLRPKVLRVAAFALIAGMVGACSSSGSAAPPTSAGVASTSTASGATAPAPGTTAPGSTPSTSGTVWLCRPGQSPDPCAQPVRLTVDHGHGSTTTVTPAVATNSPYDCFYVYPTVSPESGENADLVVQSAETNVAIEQASPFSQVCRIWAPMYRQVTLSGLFKADAGNLDTAYQSLLSGWNDYLQHYNDGRPVIIIGHSQGAAMAIRLIAAQVDPDPAVRSRLVAALVLGGNLTVPTGRTVGAAFQHIPLCGGSTITRCAIAYSTFSSPPPAGTLFGRPGQGVSLLWLQTATAGLQVACVNPAGLGGGPGSLQPELLGAGGWVSYPDEYTATCRSVAGATWLQVDATNPAGRPVVAQTIGPTWGLHIYDVNLATGNLVQDVAAAERAFSAGG